MKKRLKINGQVATIQVTLNHTQQRSNTDQVHQVIVNGFNCDYDAVELISSKQQLEDELMRIEQNFIHFAQSIELPKNTEEIILQKLGYQ